MCGIAAIFAYGAGAPGVDEGELTAIRDHMTARGPDGAGVWFAENRRVGLGHRRLSIIDLSECGAQPMVWGERKLAIVFNGEIYNYRELKAALEAKGHTFKSTSDTEVLLHLYAEYGEGMAVKLRGMFAFAIWDGAREGMFLARDTFGIKPLYFADDGRTMRVASQVKALMVGGKISTSLDAAGQVGFFLWGHVPEPFTLYRDVRSVPAGTTVWLDGRGRREPVRFATVTETLAPGKSSGTGSLAEALTDTVAHHLIADVPVGVFLSSGLDSTTLAALAAEQGGSLRTVTLGFEEFRGTDNDEVPLAELVAKRYGAQHQTVWVKREDFQSHVDQLFRAMDVPSTDGVNTYFVSMAARRAGLKVALSGLGGDELFGGYPSFTQIPQSVAMLGMFPPGNAMGRGFRRVSAPVLKRMTSPKYAGLLEYGGGYGGAYLLRRGMFMPWELPEVLDADLVRAGWNELQSLVRLEESIAGLGSPRAKVSALEMNWYMRNQLLRDADWAGMAHSLEIRVPLVDVELLRAVAPRLATNPPSKLEMADAPVKKLPPEVLNRPKTGFRIPVRDWLLGESAKSGERGLRGWAKHVYSHFTGN